MKRISQLSDLMPFQSLYSASLSLGNQTLSLWKAGGKRRGEMQMLMLRLLSEHITSGLDTTKHSQAITQLSTITFNERGSVIATVGREAVIHLCIIQHVSFDRWTAR